MIPEIGSFLLCIGLCISILQSLFYLNILFSKNKILEENTIIFFKNFTIKLANLNFIIILCIVSCLFYVLLTDDFSVLYVMNNSNSYLPWYYKISAFWSAHEGSFLFFLFTIIIFNQHLIIKKNNIIEFLQIKTLTSSLFGIIIFFFYMYTLIISNPFVRISNQQIDGADLNPLLQDIGLILHPPILYLSYGSLSVVFSLAIITLTIPLDKKIIFTLIYKYVLFSLIFLSLGIVLGSWWAYKELGWGGWWFWDPVENSSLLPWLICIILIHSLILTRKKETFCKITLILCILTFLLCILSTYIVRSGILPSLHTFANNFYKTYAITIFLIIFFMLSSILMYFNLKNIIEKKILISFYSKEFYILYAIIILSIVFIIIFIGTILPILIKIIINKNIIIDHTYYNYTFIPIFLCCIPLLGIAHKIPWFYQTQKNYNKKKYIILFSIIFNSILILCSFFLKYYNILFFLILSYIYYFLYSIFNSISIKKEFINVLCTVMINQSNMLFAHLGILFTSISILISIIFSIEKEIPFILNKNISLGHYTIYLKNIENITENNYIGYKGNFLVKKNNINLKEIYTEKRIYINSGISITKITTFTTIFFDIYLALGEPIGINEWSGHLYFKPFVRCIWGSLIFTIIGIFSHLIIFKKN